MIIDDIRICIIYIYDSSYTNLYFLIYVITHFIFALLDITNLIPYTNLL